MNIMANLISWKIFGNSLHNTMRILNNLRKLCSCHLGNFYSIMHSYCSAYTTLGNPKTLLSLQMGQPLLESALC